MSALHELIWNYLLGGGGSAVLIQKTITANGTFAAADDNADGYSSVTVEVPGGGGRYTLLASGSYTKAEGTGSPLNIPVTYSGTPMMYGVIASEALENTAQAMCECVLLDKRLIPEELATPNDTDGFAFAWGYRADGSTVNQSTSIGEVSINASSLTFFLLSSTYPWRPNTYRWYIWGVAE